MTSSSQRIDEREQLQVSEEPETSGDFSHSDDLFKMGRYSIFLCIFVELAMLSQLSNLMFMVYAGASPSVKSCENLTFSSNEEYCKNYDLCKSPKFERQFYGITEQFNLLCDDAKIEKLGTSIQMVGIMIGCLVFGQLADLYGRKKPMMICLCMCFVFGICSAYSSNFTWFTIQRTILSFFNGGQSTITLVYMIENIPKRTRGYIPTLISYSPNVILLGFIAFFSQTWSRLAIVISILTLPPILMLIFLHESPRWLMQKGKVTEAKNIFLAIEKFDGRKLLWDDLKLQKFLEFEHRKQVMEANAKVGKHHSFWHLLETKEILTGTLVIAFTFFATTLVNYSIMFNLGAVAGSIYINSILIGLLRYSFSLLSGFLDFKFEKFNRKMGHGVCAIITLIIISAIIVFYMTKTTSIFSTVIRIGVLTCCAMTSQGIIVASITSNELMPTAIRSISFSTALICSRFGIVLAPHVFHLNLYTGFDYPVLPYAILLAFVIVDFLFFQLLIPETKNKPLKDFIEKHETDLIGSNRGESVSENEI